jgi:hypothetical protein
MTSYLNKRSDEFTFLSIWDMKTWDRHVYMNTTSSVVVVGAGPVGIMMYISLSRNCRPQPAIVGENGRGTKNPENLHHDPITRKMSQLLITKSMTNGNNTRRPAPLASWRSLPWKKLSVAPYSMPRNNIVLTITGFLDFLHSPVF